MPVISPRSPIGAANPHIYLRWFQPPDGASYTDGPSTSYTYDLGDRLTQVVDSISGTINLTHDGLDRLTQETTPQGTVSYTYDAASRRTSMTVTGQPQVTYGYDNANRLTSVTQSGSTVSMGYDGVDRRTSLRLPTAPNAVTVDYTHDAAGQLTTMIYKLGTTLLGDLTYGYDMNGNRISMGGSFARTTLPQALDYASYDAANRITQWGNLTVAYNYDFNGNRTGDLTNTYVWDARNRLASMTGASFQYDPFGRRTSKTVGGTTTSFLYDDFNIVQELSGGSPTANLLAGLNFDEVFTRTDAGGARTILADGLGSTMALLDSAGATQTQYTYEPFGKVTASGAASSNTVQYTGRENDGTGLLYYRARYYSAVYHRFISEDPRGPGGNGYQYVASAPTSFVDPLGLTKLRYNVRKGILTVDPERPGTQPYQIKATSGRGQCMNNPDCSLKQDTGPIPPGYYSIRVSDLSAPDRWGIIKRYIRTRADWGSLRVPLIPNPGTRVGTRFGFYLHGGRFPGSAGCIDVGGGLFGNDETRRLIQDLLSDPDGWVPVTVE